MHIQDFPTNFSLYPICDDKDIFAAVVSPNYLNDIFCRLPDVEITLPTQTHSVNVAEAINGSHTFPDTDALFTYKPELAVGVRTADCVPILLFAPDIRAVAAIHAGWKGTIGRICSLTVERLTTSGADPSLIRAWICPSVCGACYEVSADLARRFRSEINPLCVSTVSGSPHIDLAAANTSILESAGITPQNIRHTDLCTRHSFRSDHALFPSWRREPGVTRRLVSFIFMKH